MPEAQPPLATGCLNLAPACLRGIVDSIRRSVSAFCGDRRQVRAGLSGPFGQCPFSVHTAEVAAGAGFTGLSAPPRCLMLWHYGDSTKRAGLCGGTPRPGWQRNLAAPAEG